MIWRKWAVYAHSLELFFAPRAHLTISQKRLAEHQNKWEGGISHSSITEQQSDANETVRNRDHYARLKDECAQNPGLFHGKIAKRQICWFLSEQNAWAFFDEAKSAWRGWDAASGEAVLDERIGVSEEEWEVIGPLLPAEHGRGCRPAQDNRPYFEGMMWIARTGA